MTELAQLTQSLLLHQEQRDMPAQLSAFRRSLQRFQSDHRILQSISRRPADPGPLNPEMLAIRTLSALHKLAPDHLSLWATYADALFELEELANRLSNPANAGAKASRPTGSRPPPSKAPRKG